MGWKDLINHTRHKGDLPISWRGLSAMRQGGHERPESIAKRSYLTLGVGVSLVLGIVAITLFSVAYHQFGQPAFPKMAALAQDNEKEAFSMMGLASAEVAPVEQLTDSSLELHAPGRPDPFAPLLDEYQAQSGEKERDVLDNVYFTGYVDEPHTKKKVAIIKVANPVSGDQSLVKKIGDSFEIDGHQIVVKDVRNHMLQLTAAGKARELDLVEYNNDPAGTSGAIGNAAANTQTANAGIVKLPGINSSSQDTGKSQDSEHSKNPPSKTEGKVEPSSPKLQEL